MKREVQEINEIIRVIRNEDDEKVFMTETRLFNGVIDDNKMLEEDETTGIKKKGKSRVVSSAKKGKD